MLLLNILCLVKDWDYKTLFREFKEVLEFVLFVVTIQEDRCKQILFLHQCVYSRTESIYEVTFFICLDI